MDTNQRIIGDSFVLLPQFSDKSVDLIITDPPYDFSQEQKETLHKEFLRISRGWVIVFSPPENQWVENASQYLFWVKPISTKNTIKKYSRFVEMIFVYGSGLWNTTRHWSQYTNVFSDLVMEGEHPFEKPLSLIERLIKNHSKEGDIILDPFFGSGSLEKACDRTNRKWIGIEINDKL